MYMRGLRPHRVRRINSVAPHVHAGLRTASRARYTSSVRRKLYLETFGCQMNVLDSELVLGQLRAHGYEQVDDRESADVIIYNTCSVRQHAEQKVWSRLGELRGRKASDPGLVIGVIGCMAERDGANISPRRCALRSGRAGSIANASA